jgi:23S rRNA (uridine2552-2'-O)-methyltransferase
MPKPYIPNDKWSQRAAADGYRARSVYKLMEIDDKFGILREGDAVIDLGAAPGSWLQYASQAVGPKGIVLGFDLQDIEPVAENVKTFKTDILDRFAVQDVVRQEGIVEINAVLSDVAPSTSGVKDVDQWKSVELAQASFAVAADLLKRGGWIVVKVFRGSDFDEFLKELKTEWKNAKVFEAEASRDRSREVYVIARR